MTTQIDTTGTVLGLTLPNGKGGVQPDGAWTWDALDAFTQGYIEAAAEDLVRRMLDDPDATYSVGQCRSAGSFAAFAPETLARIIEDCAWLCTDAASRAANAEAGREAWAVRQAGKMAHAEPLTVLLGDDGKVRFA